MGLFRDKEADKFGDDLAAELARRFPPRAMSGDKVTAAKRETALAKALEHVAAAARTFSKDHKVGILKQVGFSKRFQARLDELGYDEEFIKAVTLRLAQSMAAK